MLCTIDVSGASFAQVLKSLKFWPQACTLGASEHLPTGPQSFAMSRGLALSADMACADVREFCCFLRYFDYFGSLLPRVSTGAAEHCFIMPVNRSGNVFHACQQVLQSTGSSC